MTPGLFGQKSTINYDLSSYKLPVMKRQVLELQFGLNGKNQKSNIQNVTDSTITSNQSFFSNITPNYSFYLNTKKFQVSNSINISPLNYNYAKSKNNGSSNLVMSYNPSISYSGSHRYYFVKKFFVEADLNFDYKYDNTKNELKGIPTENKTSTTNSNLFVSVPLSLGWGRIERVEDARLAVYILDDLNKAGKIGRELTNDEITQFASLISEIKNKRFFDSREQKIYELQQMDSFLVSNKIVVSPDITYFSLMNDNWDYSSEPIRESGFKVNIGISPSYSNNNDVFHNNNDSSQYRKEKTENSYFNGIMDIEYEKPLNLFWQLSVSDMLSGGKNRMDLINSGYIYADTSKANNWSLQNSLNAFLSYYPNSRTEMSLGSSLSYYINNYRDLKASPDMDDSFYNRLNETVSLNVSYYISPRVRFGFNSSYNYNIINNKAEDPNGNIKAKSKFNNFTASASLIYKIL